MPDLRNMKNENHMNTFPPQSKFIFCFKSIKQNNSTSEKTCFYLRFLNVEKRVQKRNLNKNDRELTPEKITTGKMSTLFYWKNKQPIHNKTCVEKLKKIQYPTHPFDKGIISTILYKARLEFDSFLAARFSKIRPCI